MHAFSIKKITKKEKKRNITEDSSYWHNPYDCMGLKRLKLEIAILQVVFNGHAFSRYHHEVFGGIRFKGWKFILFLSPSLTSYPEFGFSVLVSLLLKKRSRLQEHM